MEWLWSVVVETSEGLEVYVSEVEEVAHAKVVEISMSGGYTKHPTVVRAPLLPPVPLPVPPPEDIEIDCTPSDADLTAYLSGKTV